MTLFATITWYVATFLVELIATPADLLGNDSLAYQVRTQNQWLFDLAQNVGVIERGINRWFAQTVSTIADPIGGPLWSIATVFYGLESVINHVADLGLRLAELLDPVIYQLRTGDATFVLFEVSSINYRAVLDLSGFYRLWEVAFSFADGVFDLFGGLWHFLLSGPAALFEGVATVFYLLGSLSPIEAATATIGVTLLLSASIFNIFSSKRSIVTPVFGVLLLFCPLANFLGTLLLTVIGTFFAVYGLFNDRGRTFAYGVAGTLLGGLSFLFEAGFGLTGVLLLGVLGSFVYFQLFQYTELVEYNVVPRINKDKALFQGGK